MPLNLLMNLYNLHSSDSDPAYRSWLPRQMLEITSKRPLNVCFLTLIDHLFLATLSAAPDYAFLSSRLLLVPWCDGVLLVKSLKNKDLFLGIIRLFWT